MEEIDDGVRGSVCGVGIEIERDRELAERSGAASSMVAGLCSASSFYRRGEAGLTVRRELVMCMKAVSGMLGHYKPGHGSGVRHAGIHASVEDGMSPAGKVD